MTAKVPMIETGTAISGMNGGADFAQEQKDDDPDQDKSFRSACE